MAWNCSGSGGRGGSVYWSSVFIKAVFKSSFRFTYESNQGHIGGRRALSPLHHPCSLVWFWNLYVHPLVARRKREDSKWPVVYFNLFYSFCSSNDLDIRCGANVASAAGIDSCCGASVASEQQLNQDLRRIYKRGYEFSNSPLLTRMHQIAFKQSALPHFLPKCTAPRTTRRWHAIFSCGFQWERCFALICL